MADYRDLLRRAVEALPENNGAARRQVYEKARAALLAQLRALDPPLPSREITQHRLQLEDCIRQVEQEATEQLLGGLKHQETTPAPVAAAPVARAAAPATQAVAPEPVPTPVATPEPEDAEEPERDLAAAEAPPVAPEPEADEPEEAADPDDSTDDEAETVDAAEAAEADDEAEREAEADPAHAEPAEVKAEQTAEPLDAEPEPEARTRSAGRAASGSPKAEAFLESHSARGISGAEHRRGAGSR